MLFSPLKHLKICKNTNLFQHLPAYCFLRIDIQLTCIQPCDCVPCEIVRTHAQVDKHTRTTDDHAVKRHARAFRKIQQLQQGTGPSFSLFCTKILKKTNLMH